MLLRLEILKVIAELHHHLRFADAELDHVHGFAQEADFLLELVRVGRRELLRGIDNTVEHLAVLVLQGIEPLNDRFRRLENIVLRHSMMDCR